jgi:protein-tyrosine phosphatase
MEGSIALARAAAEAGTRTLAATPHVREDHPFELEEIERRVEATNAELEREGVDLRVVPGAEVALTRLPELDDDALRGLCLGDGAYLLVESPYTYAPELLEKLLYDLQDRGFKPILAHPERSPSFLSDLVRLARIVDKGVLCSITALSMTGAFGAVIQRFTSRLFSEGLVHDVASDAHDTRRRPPGLGEAFERLDSQLPGLAGQAGWFTVEAPRAILGGQELPPPPERVAPAKKGLRKVLKLRRQVA